MPLAAGSRCDSRRVGNAREESRTEVGTPAEDGTSVTVADERPVEPVKPTREDRTRAAWAALQDCAPRHADPVDIGRWRNRTRLAVVVAVDPG
jgi:hypothetical protein